ncbi:hypothetical protein ACQ86G_18650 [Roseateles chitinivorans]|uniref:hypothetical protein n=1 Tax=Roseateles chitinivorans TaxID=2917965 RepID=UPI003D66FFAE
MKHLITPSIAALMSALFLFTPAEAADHLDTPTVIADPAADIGDLYAWTSADGRRLNLVMDIVGKRFSDQVQYVFLVDSGQRYGATTVGTRLLCQFEAAGVVRCWVGREDGVQGDAGAAAGLTSRSGRLRVFAGQRDDPYFNNVRGTRAALNAAAEAIRADQAPPDASGVPRFDERTVKRIGALWGQTEGGPARNFLAGWTTSALVVSVDLGLVNAGGPMLAVWGRTERRQEVPTADAGPPPPGAPIDRMGRALTGNALLATIGTDEAANALKEAYNRAGPADWQDFAPEIGRNLALYDGFDGVAGNQWLVEAKEASPGRHRRLAALLADDRLWVDSRQTRCEVYLAVERRAAGAAVPPDCGGRTPLVNVNAVFRSLLIRGTPDVADDGVTQDDRAHSTVDFPFLAAAVMPAGSTASVASAASAALAVSAVSAAAAASDPSMPSRPAAATTQGVIAIANLDHLIHQHGTDPAAWELSLMRLQFLADYRVLDQAAALAAPSTVDAARGAAGRLRQARALTTLHRFAQAERVLDAARATPVQRAALLVATGRAGQALPVLRDEAARRPDFASLSALARAEAGVGRLEAADRHYAQALTMLDTTWPFPAAAVAFARGLMWTEQGGDPVRGAAFYEEALRLLPDYAAAGIHLAELELARGDDASAQSRLLRVVRASEEPEALALLGELHLRQGETALGREEIVRAKRRYEALLARHPQAFADHAAEFYLGAGRDARRAWVLAQANLRERPTRRAYLLAIRAAEALALTREAASLRERRDARHAPHAA